MRGWAAVIRHHDARVNVQRNRALLHRAAAIQAGRRALGSLTAVAEATGRSLETLSKAANRARRMAPRDPLADMWVLDLPASAGAVPLRVEWEEMYGGERIDASVRAAAYWRAQAKAAAGMFEQVLPVSEALAALTASYEPFEVVDDYADEQDMLAELAQAADPWPAPASLAEARALADVMTDLARALLGQRDAALREAEVWDRRFSG